MSVSHPKYLLGLKIRAESALNAEPPDGLTGFALAWTLWEAVRRRMLYLACKREGWSVEQAGEALLPERIDNARFEELYRAITAGDLWDGSLPLAARKLWPSVLKAADLRKRIIHGRSRIGEENLRRVAWSVLRFVTRLQDHPLGDPLRELPRRSRKTKSDRSLRDRIGEAGG